MKTTLPFILILMISLSAFAQEINKTILDVKSQKEILIGQCNLDGLRKGEFGQFYQIEYGTYKPEVLVAEKIKTKLSNITMTLVMGTWCDDSKTQVPRFFKLMEKVGYDSSKITIYCVNREKKTEKGEIDNMKITLVPTFIINRNGTEVGRIVETPKVSLEADLLEILNK
jgi:thiol-disulfide isomerase/thioredoxin